MRRLTILGVVVLVAACAGGIVGVPSVPASPIASLAPGEVPLPTFQAMVDGVPVACGGTGYESEVRIHGSASDPALSWVIFWDGHREDLLWPAGFRARFDPSLVVLDGADHVVAREGERVTGGCPMPPDGLYIDLPTVPDPPGASSSPDADAAPLGSLRIPFAGREMEVTIVGQPGIVTGWRAASEAEVASIAWADGSEIELGRLTDRELVLGWLGTVCDLAATLTVAPGRLAVDPLPRAGCDAMAVGRGAVLTFAAPVDPASVGVELGEAVLLPEPS